MRVLASGATLIPPSDTMSSRRSGRSRPRDTVFSSCLRRSRDECSYLLHLARTVPNAEVDLPDKHGDAALFVALSRRFYAVAEILLMRGANPYDSRTSVLHEAVTRGDATAVLMVASNCPEVMKSRRGRWTPVHMAVMRGNLEIFEIFFQAGGRAIFSYDDSTETRTVSDLMIKNRKFRKYLAKKDTKRSASGGCY